MAHLDIKNILKSFSDLGCQNVLIKKLSPNDNSKNQVYIGGEKAIQYLPFTSSELVEQKSKKKNASKYIFRNILNFHWITETGIHSVPEAKVIFYPQYPESRFSGFLKGCKESPSHIIGQKLENRYLILSFNREGKSFGYTDFINKNFISFLKQNFERYEEDIFFESPIESLIKLKKKQSLDTSIDEIKKAINSVCSKGWIKSKKFDDKGNIIDYNAVNGGGVTLETELGVKANSDAGPDYKGWELKQHSGPIVTLFTPEPDGGYYNENGIEAFIKCFGYPDRKGKKNRLNFGGVHKVSDLNFHHLTNLKLSIYGFKNGNFTKKNGHVGLLNKQDEFVAYWSFTKMLRHWQKKHSKTCYITSERKKVENSYYYKYSRNIELGIESSFIKFLLALEKGIIFYDPASKIFQEGNKLKKKARNQFRIKKKDLHFLYSSYLKIDL